ncbi:hypothetical protein JAAARDRAFT_36327 [Jaapia argillacea MUCL 33604]|uniref:Uncharacterized protein n=1 Tax=Jaapia argillacea MUCL 33604 TaxID=933084 RepID=A0A067PPX5_9AGAM|nr:hypothetical protein JAAARDRAFT_36327 [Jaapia argillacea MUCL 33604]
MPVRQPHEPHLRHPRPSPPPSKSKKRNSKPSNTIPFPTVITPSPSSSSSKSTPHSTPPTPTKTFRHDPPPHQSIPEAMKVRPEWYDDGQPEPYPESFYHAQFATPSLAHIAPLSLPSLLPNLSRSESTYSHRGRSVRPSLSPVVEETSSAGASSPRSPHPGSPSQSPTTSQLYHQRASTSGSTPHSHSTRHSGSPHSHSQRTRHRSRSRSQHHRRSQRRSLISSNGYTSPSFTTAIHTTHSTNHTSFGFVGGADAFEKELTLAVMSLPPRHEPYPRGSSRRGNRRRRGRTMCKITEAAEKVRDGIGKVVSDIGEIIRVTVGCRPSLGY